MIKTIALGMVTNLLYDTGKFMIKELTKDNRSEYEKELCSIIEAVIAKHKQEFDTEDSSDGRYSFIKSQKLLEILLNFDLRTQFPQNEVAEAFKSESNVYPPKDKEIEFFLTDFKDKINSSSKFKDLYFDSKYKREIFRISREIDNLKNNNVKVITDSISRALKSEYKSNIESIQTCIDEFKMHTAITLIQQLRKRIEQASLLDNYFKSKLLYLETLCERELQIKDKIEISKQFIQAYNLDKTDLTLKLNACLSYFYVKDNQEALDLSNQIIQVEKYRQIPWLIKIFTAPNHEDEFINVPSLLKEDKLFINVLFFNSIILQKESFHNYLINKGYSVDVEFYSLSKLSLRDKIKFSININLLVNTILGSKVLDLQGDFYLKNYNSEINILFKHLEFYVKELNGTEIEHTIRLEKYFLNFIEFLFDTNENNLTTLSTSYELSSKSWSETFTFCQAHQALGRIKQSNAILDNYERAGNVITPDWFILKCIHLNQLEQYEDLGNLYEKYLESIEVINHDNLLNVINMFSDCLMSNERVGEIDDKLEFTLKKRVENDSIKHILEVYIRAHLLKEKNDELIDKTLELIHFEIENEIMIYCIAESLIAQYLLIEARDFLKGKIDLKSENKLLRFYVVLLYRIVRDRSIHANDIHIEILDLLKKWRTDFKSFDYELLCFEFELLAIINDETLIEVGEALIINFNEREWSNYTYIYSLKLVYGQDFELKHNILTDFENEKIGLLVFNILKSNSTLRKLAFRVIFNLSKIDTNKDSRTIYFSNSYLFGKEFFRKYSEVKEKLYVLFEQDGKKIRKQIKKKDSLIGRKVGEQYNIQNSLTGKDVSINILEVYGEELNLFYEIMDESEDQTSGLGLISMDIPSGSPEKMKEFLIDNFGELGSRQQEFSEKEVNKYLNFEIGFIEITRVIFKENFIDSYYHLTSHEKFTIFPSCLISPVVNSENPKFVLDKSSLMLFFELTTELDFNFKHKFIISKLIVNDIKNNISVLKNDKQSKLTTNITSEKVDVISYPDNYNEEKIKLYSRILDWINENCTPLIVKEKIDIVLKLDNSHQDDDYLQCMIETIMLSNKDDHFLITDDIFMYRTMSNIHKFILNSEHFIEQYYTSNLNNDFYELLLNKNYLGIKISKDVIISQFLKKILGNANYYPLVLENLSYKLDTRLEKNTLIADFIRYIFLMSGITIENQGIYAFEILSQTLIGAPKQYRSDLYKKINENFKLLGVKYGQIVQICSLLEKQFL